MAKPKSVKLRSLIMLRTLFKCSDAKHPVGLKEINEQLQPHALDCNRESMNSTLKALEELGIKVSYNTQKFLCKAWLDDRPLSDSDISCLVFALTTNPHISKEQAAKILEKLKSFVTVYQELLLFNNVESADKDEGNDSLWEVFSSIQKACSANCKIQYTKHLLKYNKEEKYITLEESVPIWFTPKCVYRAGNELYMVGFKRSDLFPETINLKDIASVRLPTKPVYAKVEQASVPIFDILTAVDLPKDNQSTVYQGSATFRGRWSCLQLLYSRFGPPSHPVKKDSRSVTTYHVDDLTLSSDDLNWLSQIPGFGIRIIGPKALVRAVDSYYKDVSATLLNPVVIPRKDLPENEKVNL